MNKVTNHIDYLKVLQKCNHSMRCAIIKSAKKDLIHTICECVLNCLNGNITLNESDKAYLKRYKRRLRQLLRKQSSLKQKKHIICQSGGSFLPIILSSILSAISEL